MTTFYLDPVGGNDALDGTTFATRWKTFTTGATTARLPGWTDDIRVIASPEPAYIGQGNWDASGVTLPATDTASIIDGGNWTGASTNASLTTSTNRKLGSNSSSVAVNATFTTGRAAYFTFAQKDLSQYQQISLWINMTAGSMAADGDISICLCSDTLGNTVVNTINIPRIQITNGWNAVSVDNLSSLGSSIQSVALYINQDRGAQTFLLNNIFAAKSPALDNTLTLNSLIGQSVTGPWYTIQTIVGTRVTAEQNPTVALPTAFAANPIIADSGNNLPIWKRDPLLLPSTSQGNTNTNTVFGLINFSGINNVNRKAISGGWNRTDMSTQTGETYISATNGTGHGLSAAARNWISLSKFSLVRFNSGLNFSTASFGWNVSDMDIAGSAGAFLSGSDIQNSNINIRNITGVGASLSLKISGTTLDMGLFCGRNGIPFNMPAMTSTININKIGTIGSSSGYHNIYGLFNVQKCIFNISNVLSSCFLNDVVYLFVQSSMSSKNNIFNFNGNITPTTQASNSLINTVGASNNTFFINGSMSARQYIIKAYNQSIGNKIYNSPAGTSYLGYDSDVTFINSPYSEPVFEDMSRSVAIHTNVANNPLDHRITARYEFGRILTDTTTRHTDSGISWRMNLYGSGTNPAMATEAFPLTLPLAKIAVNSNSLVTANVWVRRTLTTVDAKLVCRGGQIAGVVSDVTAQAAGAINTWEQLTITFTPTQSGVVELEVQGYGIIDASIYVDDFTVSQA